MSFEHLHLNTGGPVSACFLAVSTHSAPFYCWTDNLMLALTAGWSPRVQENCSLVAFRAKRLLKKKINKNSLLAKRPWWCTGNLLKGQPSILRIKSHKLSSGDSELRTNQETRCPFPLLIWLLSPTRVWHKLSLLARAERQHAFQTDTRDRGLLLSLTLSMGKSLPLPREI